MLRVLGRRGEHHVRDQGQADPVKLHVRNLLSYGAVLQHWIPQVLQTGNLAGNLSGLELHLQTSCSLVDNPNII